MRIISFLLVVLALSVFAARAQGSFGEPLLISALTNAATCVYACDIDGDGDEDVLSSSYFDNKIAWYRNNGSGTFSDQIVISSTASGANSVFACDLDGDGDNDVLSACWLGNRVCWYENTDGKGSFSEEKVITGSTLGAHSVYACDIDGDGDIDVLSASYYDHKIAWYENTDGKGTFGPQRVIIATAYNALSVFAIDLDGDNDTDVLSASRFDNKIAWYENTDGTGTFGPRQIITTSTDEPFCVFACDIDNDGDNDVLSASEVDNKIAWFENMDGNGTFSAQQIITTSASGAEYVRAGDIDLDGDADVLSASYYDSKIAWYKNTDGTGAFGPQQIITTGAIGAFAVGAADLDGDGDLDVLSASGDGDKIEWYRNDCVTSAGDEEDHSIQLKYDLMNYPNPFNPITVIQYELRERGLVTLKVLDVLGHEVATLVNEEKPRGRYRVEFDAGDLASGIYFYRLKAGEYVESRKMVLIR